MIRTRLSILGTVGVLLGASQVGFAKEEAPVPDAGPTFSYDPGKGFLLEDVRGRASLELSLWVAPALRLREPGGGEAGDALIRRGRLGFEARLPHQLSVVAELDLLPGVIDVGDLYGKWAPLSPLAISFGFLKPPTGLERETSPRDLPFLERSAVSLLTVGREVGVRFDGKVAKGKFRYALALTRGDRDADLDDPGNADLHVRLQGVPGPLFAASLRGGLLFRPDGAPGVKGENPFGDEYFQGLNHQGTSTTLGADACLAHPRFRVVAEGVILREGLTEGTVSGHTVALASSLLLGFSPVGTRDDARDGGGLRKGLEILGRVDVAHFAPAPGSGDSVTRSTLTGGVAVAPLRQLRLQGEVWGELPSSSSSDLSPEVETATPHRFAVQFWAAVGL